MSDAYSTAMNIVNQIGDLLAERTRGSNVDWVHLRQETNDELDEFVRGVLAVFEREARAEAWNEGQHAGVENQMKWDGWRFAPGYPLPNPYRTEEEN